MTPTSERAASSQDLLAESHKVARSLVLSVVAGALTVGFAGDPASMRAFLGLDLDAGGPGPTMTDVVINNANIALSTIGCAWVRQRAQVWLRKALDCVVGTIWLVNVTALAIALGAYGFPLAAQLAPHLIIELLAFSLAGGAYLAARTKAVPLGLLIRTALVCGALTTLGALVETGL